MANYHPNTSGLRRGRPEPYGNLPDDLGHMRYVINHSNAENDTRAQAFWRRVMEADFSLFTKLKLKGESDRLRLLARRRQMRAKLNRKQGFYEDGDWPS